MKHATAPHIVRRKDGISGQSVTELHFPSGAIVTVDPDVATIPRNLSAVTAIDAIRSPGLIFSRSNDICTVWFAWSDGETHGQYQSRQEAVEACLA